jgi:hypothetical protein
MFRSPYHDHLQGSSFVLSAFTTFRLPALSFVFFGYVAICHLFVCVSGVAVCGLSGRETIQYFKTNVRVLHLCKCLSTEALADEAMLPGLLITTSSFMKAVIT